MDWKETEVQRLAATMKHLTQGSGSLGRYRVYFIKTKPCLGYIQNASMYGTQSDEILFAAYAYLQLLIRYSKPTSCKVTK
jgi:hypothetical protein